MEVRVLPDKLFGLIHGKAGVIRSGDGAATSFLGSTNESQSAWVRNYELVWMDVAPEAVRRVQEEFDALWAHPAARPLSAQIVGDVERLSRRTTIEAVKDWADQREPDPAAPIVELPVYRRENGLWAHQKYFVKLAFEAH